MQVGTDLFERELIGRGDSGRQARRRPRHSSRWCAWRTGAVASRGSCGHEAASWQTPQAEQGLQARSQRTRRSPILAQASRRPWRSYLIGRLPLPPRSGLVQPVNGVRITQKWIEILVDFQIQSSSPQRMARMKSTEHISSVPPGAATAQALLACGVGHLEHAARGEELSEYHLQAGIAAIHATSASYAETDWRRLVQLYDQLLAIAPSPVVALNRTIAQSMVEGPGAALASLEELRAEPAMKNYYLFPAVRADFLRRLGRGAEATACYQEALTYPCTKSERRFLFRRIEGLKEWEAE